ncbi:MAG TPA: MoaD/ThiS family protein [Bacteroidota bacterium]|nr:MoaD/ThiS family protein [Bacteroidota bacterium]
MIVRVLFFAIAHDLTGTREYSLELENAATVETAIDILIRKFPALRQIDQSMKIAVNKEYAGRSVELQPDDEIACLPPVSGG